MLSQKSDRLMNTDYKYENHVSFNQQMCGYQKWNQNSGGYQRAALAWISQVATQKSENQF
jgi:hypothetical protein